MKVNINLVGVLLLIPAITTAQPTIELPSDDDDAADGSGGVEPDLTRGLMDMRLSNPGTGIGGYAELHYNLGWTDFDDREAEIDLHRLVIFISHRASDDLRFYSEIEVEHALAADGAPGEVGIEQAFVDWLVGGDQFAIRAGIVLVPMGIINQWHEPPIFNGVERPAVDKVIMPSTWREGGAGVFGRVMDGSLRYEAYLVGGLNAAKFSSSSAIRGGRQKVAEASALGLALTGRVELEPMLGTVLGLSAYFGYAGSNGELFGPESAPGLGDGAELDPTVPVTMFAADIRTRNRGLEARIVGVIGFIGDSEELSGAFQSPDSTGAVGPVGSSFYGVYGEAGYNVLRNTDSKAALVPFARLEVYDTMAGTEGAVMDDDTAKVVELVAGLSYRPLNKIVFKSNYTLRSRGGGADTEHIVSFGSGIMF